MTGTGHNVFSITADCTVAGFILRKTVLHTILEYVVQCGLVLEKDFGLISKLTKTQYPLRGILETYWMCAKGIHGPLNIEKSVNCQHS